MNKSQTRSTISGLMMIMGFTLLSNVYQHDPGPVCDIAAFMHHQIFEKCTI